METQQQEQKDPYFIDPAIKRELDKIRHRVLHNDIDFVAVTDGEVGSGKSVLTMQLCKYLDPNFNLNNVCFTADEFIKIIRNPKTKKGTAIMLDEAFSAASARASLSQVNAAINALAMEMRQRNLFVFFVLPSIFDLDRTIALNRSRALFHVYFTPEMERRYVVFDMQSKKLLYLHGKKTYAYGYPKATFPPSQFFNYYSVNENDYRTKKSQAFTKRPVSNQAKNWLSQRNYLIKYLIRQVGFNQTTLNDLFKTGNCLPISQQGLSYILKEMEREGDEIDTNRIIRR